MNRQDKYKDGKQVSRGIEWTLYRTPSGIYLPGYTANPVRGCTHNCKWEMPDGTIATCYAKEIKERMNGQGSFEKITYHPDVLKEIERHRESCGIFIDSMSDLFGQSVEREWIDAVIKTIRQCPQHVFFSLTKNPSRFREFNETEVTLWPRNWLVGVSYPPTYMFGKKLTPEQQRAWFKKAMEFLANSPAQTAWVSVEPLSLNLSDILEQYRHVIKFAVIGAASNGARTHQPHPDHFKATLDALKGIPLFFKGNLSQELAKAHGGWREEFPFVPFQHVTK